MNLIFAASKQPFKTMTTVVLPKPPKARRLWTYDEMLAQLPESNLPMELWDGELVRWMPKWQNLDCCQDSRFLLASLSHKNSRITIAVPCGKNETIRLR